LTIQVIGAGFGRTGTLSLKIALEKLGIAPCHHWVELNRQPGRVRLWRNALSRRRSGMPVDWDRLFAGYKATVDWPGCSFAGELKEFFPDAKLILTIRDSSSWYDSMNETLLPLYRSMPRWLCVLLPPLGGLQGLATEVIWGETGVFAGHFHDRGRTIALFEAHRQKVCGAFPADDLLVFDVAEGYAPLCEFLGLPLPDTPFPAVNDRKSLRRRIALLRVLGAVVVALVVGFALGLLGWLL
jgi:hypothetical protein